MTQEQYINIFTKQVADESKSIVTAIVMKHLTTAYKQTSNKTAVVTEKEERIATKLIVEEMRKLKDIIE
jgi:hypothetical protein